jgi:hypothetical protein
MFCSFSEVTVMPAFLLQLSSMAKVGENMFPFKIKYCNDNKNNKNTISHIYLYNTNTS